jgi:crotonobetaine/carnitine-CoA ligase
MNVPQPNGRTGVRATDSKRKRLVAHDDTMGLGASPTFAQRWQRATRAAGDRPFLVWEGSDGGTRQWSYAEFGELTADVAGFLTSRGVNRGDAVHVALANSPAFVAVWLAATVLGATLVPSDPQASARELADCMRRTRAVVGVGSVRRAAGYREAATEQPSLHVALVDEDDTVLSPIRLGRHTGETLSASPPGPGQRLAVMFTSGTTSQPKGVVLTQANYAFTGDVMAAAAALGPDDRQLVALPMFHANAQYYSFAAAISVGASVALLSRFSASQFAAQATRHQATHASLFAAPIRMILARSAGVQSGLRLRHCWFAQNLTAPQYDDVSRLLGCRPRQLYGMTETGPAVITSHPLEAAGDVMGTVTPGCRVELRDPATGVSAGPGEVGEIVVGGERGHQVFEGYLDDAETTARSFDKDWFHTGDLASVDADGRFRFAGRRGDVLKVAGENVSTVEVESVLAAHPAVFEAAVVGEPDPVRDEVPVAYVVLRETASGAAAQELATWCAAGLSPAKRPREIRFVPELPRTSVGKIRKFMLAQDQRRP